MDPNANLEEMLRLARSILDTDDDCDERATRLAELVEALDGWLRAGGFLPDRWARPLASLNGARVERSQDGSTIFIPLPPGLHRDSGRCDCPACKGGEGKWDTLAVAAKKPKQGNDHAWTVHRPEGGVR